MSDPIKIAVVGGGYRAKVPLPVYAELAEFEPVGVWSRRPERAQELATKHDLLKGTADLDELLGLDGLEAVHVAGPVAQHAEVVIAAARRGLHVLCDERPSSEPRRGARGRRGDRRGRGASAR